MRAWQWLALCVATSSGVCTTWAAGFASPTATERTTVWQRAAHPELERWRALADVVDRKREPKDPSYDSPAIRTQLSRAAATLLELAGAERSGDVELLFLYGECLAYAGGEFATRARDVLRLALSLAPNHPNAVDAWDSLGRVNMALGFYVEGYQAFERALERQWDRDVRSAILIEQGLGALRAGELVAAVERLSGAVNDSRDSAPWALSQWALAVAMDRALMGPEAQQLAWLAAQAKFGPSGQQDILGLSEVLLEPESEVHYYRALAAMGKARQAPRELQRAGSLEAKFLWLRYVDAVGPNGAWIDRVRAHLKHIDDVEARLAPPADDLHQQALRGAELDGEVDNDEDAGVLPIWPEELEQGRQFWGGDAGTPD